MKHRCLSCPLFEAAYVPRDRDPLPLPRVTVPAAPPAAPAAPEIPRITAQPVVKKADEPKGLDALFPEERKPGSELKRFRHVCTKCKKIRVNRFANGQTCTCGAAMDSTIVIPIGKRRKYKTKQGSPAAMRAPIPAPLGVL